MNHADHVALLHDGIENKCGIWGDFGSGSGAFTLALVDLLDPSAVIYSIEKDQRSLERQKEVIQMFVKRGKFPVVNFLHLDFTKPFSLPLLNGLVLANVLHFFNNKTVILEKMIKFLQPGGRLILIEYNTNTGNPWVPYPISYETWQMLAFKTGFRSTRKIGAVKSSFLGQIYSALSVKN